MVFHPMKIHASTHLTRSEKNIQKAGDFFQIAIPLQAMVLTYKNKDAEGRKMLIKGMLYNVLMTMALKKITNKQRPDGGDSYSFPSGHTSVSFQAASFIGQRYGHKKAILPYLCASFVGVSRIKSKRHDTQDVIAGLSLGSFTSITLTKRF